MLGGWYDIVMNLWNWLGFLVLIVLSWIVTYQHTKNLWWSSIPTILICGLPLVYFHAVDGYMELPSALYAILTMYGLYHYLKTRNNHRISFSILSGIILANVKNDGIIVYFPPLIIAFLLILVLEKKGYLIVDLKNFFAHKRYRLTSMGIL